MKLNPWIIRSIWAACLLVVAALWAFTKPNLVKKAEWVELETGRLFLHPTEVRYGSGWVEFKTDKGEKVRHQGVYTIGFDPYMRG